MNYEFDTKDLVCLALSSIVGVWYLLRKVREPLPCSGGPGTGLDLAQFCTRRLQAEAMARHVQWDPNLLFLLFSALDRQQPLRAGILPQWGGAAALEQRQHWLHFAWRPLHLRRLLGKQERSLGQT